MNLLAPYRGPWTTREAAHFLRRTGFGPAAADLARATRDGLAATLGRAFAAQPETAEFEASQAALRRAHADNDIKRLQAWWLFRMRHSANGLPEKLALLWHNHFATSNAKVRSVEHMAEQHDLLRRHAAGNFGALLRGMSKDGAMLAWLDGDNNRKRHANENFAREIMELFALGVGNYSERDIQEAARAFTGWRIRDGRFWFDETQHDTRPKTLFGKAGTYTGEHVVEICLGRPACPRFVALKLLKGFVCDQPAPAEIAALAAELSKSGLEIAPALKTLLGSELFFAKVGAMVKSPLDYAHGAWRALGLRPNLGSAEPLLADLGQSVFEPATVKGWEGGRRWLTAATLLLRSQFAAETVFGGKYGHGLDLAPWRGADAQTLADRLLARRPEPAALARLDHLLKGGDDGVRDALHLALTMPECQLMQEGSPCNAERFDTAVALGAAPPLFVARTAAAAAPGADQRVLVILELAGGNDGLNTVAPYDRDEYRRARPGIGLKGDEVLKLSGGMGLHPRMAGMKKLWDAGTLSIVQGVGYPNPNRSHFRSMDIWHTGVSDREDLGTGWLGRALDAHAARFEGRTPAVALGADKLPLALLARSVAVPSLRNLDHYQLGLGETSRAGAPQAMAALLAGPAGDDDLAFVRRTARVAYDTAERLQGVAKTYKAAAEYPDTHVANMLKTVAQMVVADFGPRVYYVSMGGFDTHSQQQAAHAALLGEASDALTAFRADLAGHKVADRAALVAFSEFGRRVQENGSLGTDHGAAGPVFVVRPDGAKSAAGFVGKLPSLTDLDDGDLKHHTDFRQVYATLLDQWLGLDSAAVLGKKYAHLPLV